MNELSDFIWLNVSILLVLAGIGWIIGAWMSDRHDSGKGVGSFVLFCWGLGISFCVWVIYIVIHFISKFW